MRGLVLSSAAVIFVTMVLVLAGCNSMEKSRGNSGTASQRPANTAPGQPQQPQQPQQAQQSVNTPSDGAQRITTYELNDLLNQGKAVVVDVRNDAAYKQSHVKGAILIPSNEIENRMGELPRDKMIVTYCS